MSKSVWTKNSESPNRIGLRLVNKSTSPLIFFSIFFFFFGPSSHLISFFFFSRLLLSLLSSSRLVLFSSSPHLFFSGSVLLCASFFPFRAISSLCFQQLEVAAAWVIDGGDRTVTVALGRAQALISEQKATAAAA